MEPQTLNVVVITTSAVVIVQLLFLYLRSIFIKYMTGHRPLFNPFERVAEWSNKDWRKGELYGRASTIQKYGLTKYCTDSKIETDAVKEIEQWDINKNEWAKISAQKQHTKG